MLYGRDSERSVISALIDDAREGRGGVLVLRGPPGVGKSALLDAAVASTAGMRVLGATGTESEFELPFAALHQLLRPVMSLVDQLPAPQQDALRAAFGQVTKGPDNRFLVSVAVLGILDELGGETPVLCVIDDAQWLDEASVAALQFVARRVDHDPIALLIAARDGDVRRFPAVEMPELQLAGLADEAAEQLLAERAGVSVPPEVRRRLIAGTQGNPLALVELPDMLTPAQLSGREPLPWPLPITDTVQETFLMRVRHLTEPSQRLLLAAAADDTTRLDTVLSVAAELSIPGNALNSAERAELIRIHRDRLEFRHPLVRSAVYQAATDVERREVHRALAEVLVDPVDADRRAWHLALATVKPDESVVRQLEETAVRAQARGGFEAACDAMERAAQLTVQPEDRAGRLAGAGQFAWRAGHLARATRLLQEARRFTNDPIRRADADQLRAWSELSVGSAATARLLLLNAAKEVAEIDAARALAMLAAASEAAWIADDAEAGVELSRVARTVAPGDTRHDQFLALLMHGFLGLLHGEVARPVHALMEAMSLAVESGLPDLVLHAGHVAFYLGDDEAAYRLNAQTAAAARTSGAVGELLFALQRLALAEIFTGRWAAAESSASEAERLSLETNQLGLRAVSLSWLAVLAVLTGHEERYESLLTEAEELARGHALGVFDAQVHDALRWAHGLREFTMGNLDSSVAWFSAMSHPAVAAAAALDRIEAAILAGHRDAALRWLDRLDAFASHTGIDSELARVAHCRALLADGETARGLFEQAVTLHARSQRPFERARTHLAYGQFLRRGRRRVDARTHLQLAFDSFDQLNARPWAERARLELRAAGRTARKRDPSTVLQLTPQELQVARFVASGLHTREVAAQLFLSTRTVDFHLRNVFAKLGISSRTELARLPLD
jgi:DNA-binding CsgD family transcriptional regulator